MFYAIFMVLLILVLTILVVMLLLAILILIGRDVLILAVLLLVIALFLVVVLFHGNLKSNALHLHHRLELNTRLILMLLPKLYGFNKFLFT